MLVSFIQNKTDMLVSFIQNKLDLSSRQKAIRVLWNLLYFGSVTTIYNWSRIVKDSVVLHDIGGSGVIYTLKAVGTIVFAIGALQAINKALSARSFSKVLYSSAAFFVVYFFVYGFILRPLQGFIQLSPEKSLLVQQWLVNHLNFGILKIGSVIAQLFKIFIGYWTGSSLYIVCELYGSIHLSFFFWTYMTSCYTKQDGTKIFPTATIASGSFGILSALLMDQSIKKLPFDTLIKAHAFVALLCTCIKIFAYTKCMILAKLEGEINIDKVELSTHLNKIPSKESIGALQAFKELASNRYVRDVGLLVIGYGLAMTTLEGQFKNQLAILGQLSQEGGNIIAGLQNKVLLLQFAAQILITVLSYSFLRGSWLRIAMITPVTILCTSSAYFISRLFNNVAVAEFKFLNNFFLSSNWTQKLMSVAGSSSLHNAPELMMTALPLVLLGLSCGLLNKLSKYIAFDNSKERAFLCLTQQERIKGKSVIDLVCSRAGKSAAGIIYLVLLLPNFGGDFSLSEFTRTDNCALPSFVIVFLSGLMMIYATLDLNRLMKIKIRQQETTQGSTETLSSQSENKQQDQYLVDTDSSKDNDDTTGNNQADTTSQKIENPKQNTKDENQEEEDESTEEELLQSLLEYDNAQENNG